MHINKIKLIPIATAFSLLSACSSQVDPYHVVKTLDHVSRLNVNQFPLGVSIEKLKEDEFRITSKLDASGTAKRARQIALHHAANLASKNGYEGFTVVHQSNIGWCNTFRNQNTKTIGKVSGGNIARLHFKLENDRNNKGFRLASLIKKQTQTQIDAYQSTEVLEQIASEKIEFCTQKAQKRTGRHLLNRN